MNRVEQTTNTNVMRVNTLRSFLSSSLFIYFFLLCLAAWYLCHPPAPLLKSLHFFSPFSPFMCWCWCCCRSCCGAFGTICTVCVYIYRKQHIKFLHLSKKVLLTPPDEGPRVKGQRIKLQDIVDGLYVPQRANGSWIDGELTATCNGNANGNTLLTSVFSSSVQSSSVFFSVCLSL